MQKSFLGLGQDISGIKLFIVSDFEALFKRCKRSGHSGSLWIAFRWGLNLGVFNIAIYGKIVEISFKSFEQCTCI